MKFISPLYRNIYKIVCGISAGNVATYGQIARLAGLGRNARVVGYAMHSIPEDVDVPWHRVINYRGMISLSKENGQYSLQKSLLEGEGIVFANEKIDLRVFGWGK